MSKTFTPIVGKSVALTRQLALLKEFAHSDAPVHIYGETGTGKELVARTLHAGSLRVDRAFIARNCAALPDTLLQSLLFGHRRGAFTGADRDQIGLFEAADGGTLLLDEIGEMSPLLQGALLRVLQDGEFTRLGDVHSRKVDVRVVSSTNKRLEGAVARGVFREDLYFRLVTLRVDLPPLRDRRDDIRLLAAHFLAEYNARTGRNVCGFDADALHVLEVYAWPGNVRQLRAEIERACILTRPGQTIDTNVLSVHGRGDSVSVSHSMLDGGNTLPEILGQVERSLLTEALARVNGNRTKAAQLLGVSRQRLSQRLDRWHVKDVLDEKAGA